MIYYEEVLKEFKKYVEQFNSNDEMIAMKISHSYHVAELAKILGKCLEITEENINLVKTIGLLHDLGRFVQYEKTKSYNDATTKIDHGALAVDYLFKDKHIKDFAIPEKYYSIIEKAIYNHNKLEIETNLTEEELFYVHLIRDADKIDIFRQDAMMENIFIEPISPKVKEAFFEHHLIDIKEIRTKSDGILVELAYIFDIHFQGSYELLKDTDNLELYLSVVEVDKGMEEEFDNVKKEVRTYLEERIEKKDGSKKNELQGEYYARK